MEDYTALYNRMHPDPASLTPGQRRNKKYPAPHEVLALLQEINSAEYRADRTRQVRIGATYYAAHNNGLIACDGTAWSSGSEYKRHKLTGEGLHYLRWLEAKLTPKPCALTVRPCMALVTFDHFRHYMPPQMVEDALWRDFVNDRADVVPFPARRVAAEMPI